MAVTQLFSALVSLFALTAATVPDPITVGGGSGVYDNNYCVGSYGFGGPTVAWTQFGRIKVDIMYDATHWTVSGQYAIIIGFLALMYHSFANLRLQR